MKKKTTELERFYIKNNPNLPVEQLAKITGLTGRQVLGVLRSIRGVDREDNVIGVPPSTEEKTMKQTLEQIKQAAKEEVLHMKDLMAQDTNKRVTMMTGSASQMLDDIRTGKIKVP